MTSAEVWFWGFDVGVNILQVALIIGVSLKLSDWLDR